MANSHPGSYCGQDAYNNMLVTENRDESIFVSGIRTVQRIGNRVFSEAERLQRRNRFNSEGGGTTWTVLIMSLS